VREAMPSMLPFYRVQEGASTGIQLTQFRRRQVSVCADTIYHRASGFQQAPDTDRKAHHVC
jgi:hypothetical protein